MTETTEIHCIDCDRRAVIPTVDVELTPTCSSCYGPMRPLDTPMRTMDLSTEGLKALAHCTWTPASLHMTLIHIRDISAREAREDTTNQWIEALWPGNLDTTLGQNARNPMMAALLIYEQTALAESEAREDAVERCVEICKGLNEHFEPVTEPLDFAITAIRRAFKLEEPDAE